MTHPIPNAALDDRLGFLGTAGSGKTYNASGAVERLLDRKSRVVIVDPLGVWWGLRLMPDGKTASSYDVPIFGGPHGDLPLNEAAGALIGETAATMAESCIVDLSELGTKASERRFMTMFLETLYYKTTKQPMHLVVDEADLFAPQKPAKGEETLLGLMEQIVRRGRVRGFIPWVITQRPAVINKNVLSQVAGLVAFKLTASQDRDALDAWIEGQADKGQGKAIKDELPALRTGQGVVWLPGHGILKTVQFPPKVTFDSSRTPKRGEKQKRTAELKPLDLGALKERLATVETETKANDPNTLRAQIAELKRENRKLTLKSTPNADPEALKNAARRAYEQAVMTVTSAFERAFEKRLREVSSVVHESIRKFDSEITSALKTLTAPPKLDGKLTFERVLPPPKIVGSAVLAKAHAPRVVPSESASDKMPPIVRKILDVIHRSNPVALTFDAASLRAGVSRRSSALKSYLSQVEASGEVTRRDDGRFISAPGVADQVGPGVDPINEFASRLPPSYAAMLRAIETRGPLTKEEVAVYADVSPTSSGLTAGLRELQALSLIEPDGDRYAIHHELKAA